ncbi:MAG: sulfate adenylyltransferase [Candidatus Aminicenantes bacterium]|nr:sulfate adenylyltransferase [Candidatus Aminicenantes bacterium]
MIQPHGGKLIDRVLKGAALDEAKKRAGTLPAVRLDAESTSDVENIATGVFSPLEGFLSRKDFRSVLDRMRLSNNLAWTIPVVLAVDKKTADGLSIGEDVALLNPAGEIAAILHLTEKYGYDKAETAQKVFGTVDAAHPGVAKIVNMPEVLLAGPIDLIRETPTPYQKYKLSPRETRRLFQEKGWTTVVGFQTRNTPHIGHEYVQKSALTLVDGLFINPVIGKKKKGDYRDEVILSSYEELIRNYYVPERTTMAILMMEMRYAGPREAIFHAVIRKNFGCSHIIIGRDHAGVGSYYAPFAAQEIFADFPDLEITPLFFRSFFYCKKCGSVVSDKICPHGKEHQIQFRGTEIRDLLLRGEYPPAELVRPEVAKIIMDEKNPFNE